MNYSADKIKAVAEKLPYEVRLEEWIEILEIAQSHQHALEYISFWTDDPFIKGKARETIGRGIENDEERN